jgi:hypothetical protein
MALRARSWRMCVAWLGTACVWLAAAGHASAQVNLPGATLPSGNMPVMSQMPPVIGAVAEPLPADFETAVSFFDSAIPRSTIRLRFDADYGNHRPTFAEYYFPGDGFRKPESRVHMQELQTFIEYGLNEWFSTFMETPLRWVNPDRNDNLFGIGDLGFGAKFAFWNSETLLTAFQLRFSANTSQRILTGTGHWTIEPALLVNYRFLEAFTLEGQAGYWVPLGGTDYAGDIFRYGLGLSYGGRAGDQVMLVPVAEVVGWTATSGRVLVATSRTDFHVESAAGDTIVNGALGVRLTLGSNADIYAGYSRCFTGHTLFRDMARIEFRIFY